MQQKKLIILLGFISLFVISPLSAQSGNLYGASVEESAVLVRLLNARSAEPVQLRLGSVRLITNNPGDITPYYALAADIFILRYLGTPIEFIPRKGTIYSIIADDQGLTILSDIPHSDPARTQLYLYNPITSSATTLSLKTSDGATEVISGVSPGFSRYVLVNPLTIQLALFNSSGEKVSSDLSFSMERGQSLAVLPLLQTDGQFEAVIQPALIHNP